MALKLLICLLFVVGVFPTAKSDPGAGSSTIPTENPATTVTGDPATTVTRDPATTVTGDPATTVTGGPATTVTGGPATTVTGGPATNATEPPRDVCNPNPCGRGSTCQPRANETYECLCLPGDYYSEDVRQCVKAKVFPGELTYNEPYKEGMDDPTSAVFKETADKIVVKLDKQFKDTPNKYLGSTVSKLSEPVSRMTARTGIIATVEIKFDTDSKITTEEVASSVKPVGTFVGTTLCDTNSCDETTTSCTGTEGLIICECKDGYLPTDLSDRLCVACPSGEKAVNGECKPCPFGYSGLVCAENWKLILVIVGSVLGGLLLVAIILLPVVALKQKKKSKKGKGTENEKSYVNPAPMKTPHVGNGTAVPRPTPVQATPAGVRPGFGGNGVPRIPRATTNESWDRSNLEMVPSNSRQNLIPAGRNSRRFDDDDDSNPYSRPMRPQSNPYAIGRPQVNPYTSSQGHSNPYYRNDDGKRY